MPTYAGIAPRVCNCLRLGLTYRFREFFSIPSHPDPISHPHIENLKMFHILGAIDVPRSMYVINVGLLLGTTFYTTFVAGPVQFKTLPKLVFGNLQSKQFPIYFFIQSVLSLSLWWGAGAISPLLVDGWN